MPSTSNDFGFVAPAKIGDDAVEPEDVFGQLLGGENDDPEAHEASDEELGALENEFGSVLLLRSQKAALKEKLSTINVELEAQEMRMLEAMDGQGTKQFKGSDGGGCSITETYTTALDSANPAGFLEWAKEHAEELLDVQSQRRTTFIRTEYEDKGIPTDDPRFPPGLKVGTRRRLQVRSPRAPRKKAKG